MQDDNINMNRRLVEMFGIPADAISATLRMRAGQPPVLTVARMISRTGQLESTRKYNRYRLVPVENDDAEEAATDGHNAELTERRAEAANKTTDA